MKYSVIYIGLLLLILSSCSYNEKSSVNFLQQAEACMEEHPDSALNILRQFPYPERLTGEPQARYALLMTQAMSKNWILLSDSLISIATDYYICGDDSLRKGQILMYQGDAQLEKGKDKAALRLFLQAHMVVNGMGFEGLEALILSRLAQVNLQLFFFDEALIIYKKLIPTFKELEQRANLAATLSDISHAFFLKSCNDSALYYGRQAYEEAQTCHVNEVIANVAGKLGHLYCDLGEYDKAEKYIQESFIPDCSGEASFYRSMGQIYLAKGNCTKAKEYLLKAKESNDVSTLAATYYLLSDLEKQQRNYKLSLDYQCLAAEYADSLYNVELQGTVKEMGEKYKNAELLMEKEQAKNELLSYRIYILAGILCILGLLIVGYVLFSMERRLRRIQFESFMEKIRTNEAQKEQYRESIRYMKDLLLQKDMDLQSREELISHLNLSVRNMEELEEANRILKDNNIKFSVRLLRMEKMLPNTLPPTKREKAVIQLVRLKENPSPSIIREDEEWQIALDTFDWLYGDQAVPLNKLCEGFTMRGKILCYLVYLGLDRKSLASVFGLSPASIVKEKQRLKKEIGLTATDDFDNYIRSL